MDEKSILSDKNYKVDLRLKVVREFYLTAAENLRQKLGKRFTPAHSLSLQIYFAEMFTGKKPNYGKLREAYHNWVAESYGEVIFEETCPMNPNLISNIQRTPGLIDSMMKTALDIDKEVMGNPYLREISAYLTPIKTGRQRNQESEMVFSKIEIDANGIIRKG